MTAKALLRQAQILGDKRRGIPPILPISPSSWWTGIRSGRYPQPVKLGPRTTVWRANEIYELIEKLGKESK